MITLLDWLRRNRFQQREAADRKSRINEGETRFKEIKQKESPGLEPYILKLKEAQNSEGKETRQRHTAFGISEHRGKDKMLNSFQKGIKRSRLD